MGSAGRAGLRFGRRLLLVTAHPDDECMFFGPTLQAARAEGTRVFVLCLTTGDADGLGHVRSGELAESCSSLGVEAHELVSDDPRLRDGAQPWPLEAAGARVRAAAVRWEADTAVTFDVGGVSGHPDHTACYRACLWAASGSYIEGNHSASGGKHWEGRLWILETVGLVRKYSGPLEAWASATAALAAPPAARLARQARQLLEGSGTPLIFEVLRLAVTVALGSPGRPRDSRHEVCLAPSPPAVRAAMRLHRSQLVWYRRAWVRLSRYVHVNTLRLVS